MKVIIKMQAMWRGYAARQEVALIMETKRADTRYFTLEERQETVGK